MGQTLLSMKTLIAAVIPIIGSGIVAGVALAAGDGAASADPTVPPWALGVGITGGVLGGPLFAVWYSWHVTTRRIPTMEKRWHEERQATEERHAAHIQLLMANNRSDLKEMWETKRNDDTTRENRLNETLDKLSGIVEKMSCRYGTTHAQSTP